MPKHAAKKKYSTPRPVRSRAFINPQQQLSKVAPGIRPRIGRSASRGVSAPTAALVAGAMMPEGFFGAYTGVALTEQAYADAARTLGCEVAALKAVAQVETAGASFDTGHRPTILYERHVFSRNTNPVGKFDTTHPDLSSNKPYPVGGYGREDEQYVKLAQAYQLDAQAALKAASWGKFQILGENCKACGFDAVTDFVTAMTTSDCEHLRAFVKFLCSSAVRLTAIRGKQWAVFAQSYNGRDYAKFNYDGHLAAAYAQFAQAA